MKEFKMLVDNNKLSVADKVFDSAMYAQERRISELVAYKQQLEQSGVVVSPQYMANIQNAVDTYNILVEWRTTINNCLNEKIQ